MPPRCLAHEKPNSVCLHEVNHAQHRHMERFWLLPSLRCPAPLDSALPRRRWCRRWPSTTTTAAVAARWRGAAATRWRRWWRGAARAVGCHLLRECLGHVARNAASWRRGYGCLAAWHGSPHGWQWRRSRSLAQCGTEGLSQCRRTRLRWRAERRCPRLHLARQQRPATYLANVRAAGWRQGAGWSTEVEVWHAWWLAHRARRSTRRWRWRPNRQAHAACRSQERHVTAFSWKEARSCYWRRHAQVCFVKFWRWWPQTMSIIRVVRRLHCRRPLRRHRRDSRLPLLFFGMQWIRICRGLLLNPALVEITSNQASSYLKLAELNDGHHSRAHELQDHQHYAATDYRRIVPVPLCNPLKLQAVHDRQIDVKAYRDSTCTVGAQCHGCENPIWNVFRRILPVVQHHVLVLFRCPLHVVETGTAQEHCVVLLGRRRWRWLRIVHPRHHHRTRHAHHDAGRWEKSGRETWRHTRC